MSAYFDIDGLARKLARDHSEVTYYQLVNAIDGTFDEARKRASLGGETVAAEAGRRSALEMARRLFNGGKDVDPAKLAECVGASLT